MLLAMSTGWCCCCLYLAAVGVVVGVVVGYVGGVVVVFGSISLF